MFYQITKTKPKWRQVCHPNLHVTLHYNFHAINFQKVHIYYLLYLEIFMNYLFFTDGSMSFSSSRSSRLSTFSSLTTMESTSLTSNTTSPTMTNRSNVSAEKSNGSPSKVRTIWNFRKTSTFKKDFYFRSVKILLRKILPDCHQGMKMAFHRLPFHPKSNYMRVGFELQFVCLCMSVIKPGIKHTNNPISFEQTIEVFHFCRAIH